MLVLSRYVSEKIYIGDEIMIQVVRINADGSVRIGIDAPKSTNIARAELLSQRPKPGGEKR